MSVNTGLLLIGFYFRTILQRRMQRLYTTQRLQKSDKFPHVSFTTALVGMLLYEICADLFSLSGGFYTDLYAYNHVSFFPYLFFTLSFFAVLITSAALLFTFLKIIHDRKEYYLIWYDLPEEIPLQEEE